MRRKEINEKYKGAASEEKITILEQDIDLLWQKVCVYEKYFAEERNLRIKAVEALRKHEIRMFGNVKDYDKKYLQRRTTPKQMATSKSKDD